MFDECVMKLLAAVVRSPEKIAVIVAYVVRIYLSKSHLPVESVRGA